MFIPLLASSIYYSAVSNGFDLQKKKVYVQDVIREQGELVHRLLHDQSGIIYICGFVAHSVIQTLLPN